MSKAETRGSVPNLRFPSYHDEWAKKNGAQLFDNSRVKGNIKLPIYSVTLNHGLVPRKSLGRKGTDAKASDNLRARPGDLVYNMMRMWQGAVGRAEVDCMVSPAYVVLSPKSSVDSKFFNYLLLRSRSVYDLWAYSYGLTSDRLRLYYRGFSKIVYQIPSMPEQQKIVAFLDAVNAKLYTLRRKRALLAEYKRGVMQKMFTQEIRFVGDDGETFPDWENRKLGQIAEIITGKTPSTSEKSNWNGTVPFVTPTDIKENEKYQKETRRKVSGKSTKRLLPPNSILYTCIASIGKVAIITDSSISNQQINALISNASMIHNEFLYYVLLYMTPRIKRFSANTTVPIINKSDFSSINIFIPKSKTEQQKIADFLAAIDDKIIAVDEQIEQMGTFKNGLLQQMFV